MCKRHRSALKPLCLLLKRGFVGWEIQRQCVVMFAAVQPSSTFVSLNFILTGNWTANLHLSHLLNPSTTRVGIWGTTDDFATSFLDFLCSPLPSGTWRTPGLWIPWFCLPTSSSVCLVLFPLSLCLAKCFWPDLMNGRHDHITAVCVSLRWSGGLRVVRLPAESWHRFLRW